MNQHNEISTLQYMGSKARIISHICDPIIKNNSIKTVVDRKRFIIARVVKPHFL